MTTLFSHFLAQVLGCATVENVHNVVRTRLMFTPDHGRTNEAIDDFILNGTDVPDDVAFWADVLNLSPELIADAASLARRSRENQARQLPHVALQWTGQTANLDPKRPVQVSIRFQPEANPLKRQPDAGLLERRSAYTLDDLNRPGALDRLLTLANAHWQEIEQVTGTRPTRLELALSAEAG